MISRAYLSSLAISFMFAVVSGEACAGSPDPLFADDHTLEARLVAPIKQIMRERPDADEMPGTFSYVAADGSTVEFSVKIRTRGNYRRRVDVCQFAPLRLNFKKSDLDNTLFDKQDKLKLVTHCESGSRVYEQDILKEYLAYRILNTLTDISYRARLLRIRYASSDNDSANKTTYAILIESKDRLAKRIELEEQELNAISVPALEQEYLNLTSVFQYLIGNLDFSPVSASPGQPCCHNYTLFSADGKTYWPVPYDFDLTGFVEPPHLDPNPKYRQRYVRQRVYRGRCYNQDKLPATLQKFREKRAAIEDMIQAQAELDKSTRKRINSYIQSFYKLLDKEDRLLEKFADACI